MILKAEEYVSFFCNKNGYIKMRNPV